MKEVFQDVHEASGMKVLTLDDIPNCSVSDRLILELVTDDDVHLEQLSEMISENPYLAATIIGLANSAYFSARSPIYTIRDAIIKVLGMQMVKSIVLSVVLGRSLDLSRCPNFSLQDYWADALTAARFGQILLMKSGLKETVTADQVYLSGLLAGFGELILVHHYPEEMNRIIEACEDDLTMSISEQRNQLDLTQGEAGALIGRRWMLPPLVVNVMQYSIVLEYQDEGWQTTRFMGHVQMMVNAVRRGQLDVMIPEACRDLIKLDPNADVEELLPEMRNSLYSIAKHLSKID